uniref:Uncharacterized protein n=1 Tax=Anguilla anguilla TaxID=7936 RepID=A0A0E9PIA7_ANGAN
MCSVPGKYGLLLLYFAFMLWLRITHACLLTQIVTQS